MDMKKRRDMQLLYVADEAIMEEQSDCRNLTLWIGPILME